MAIAALAIEQHGNITRSQLLAVGLNSRGITDRVKSGRLFRVHRGVYAVGRPPTVPLERAAAAVLACGPHAVLSHRSALVLWNIWKRWESPFEVTVIKGDPRPNGIAVHRATLDRRDITKQLGIPVTSPARTLLDCAPAMTANALARALTEARHARILFPDDLTQALDSYTNHPGARKLKEAVQGPSVRSDWEHDFAKFCAQRGLPTPQMNAKVCGLEVDAFFPEAKLIVELDSWEHHGDRRAFENDRERDAITTAAGHVTVRMTWARMRATPEREAHRLHQTIANRVSAS